MLTWIIIGIVAIIALFCWSLYNGLISLKNQVDNSWAQIDVQLKRRADLIPNLIETVKGYAKHEKTVFEQVTKARSAMLSAETIPQKAKAADALSGTLKSLFAVAEDYPKLQANTNFLQLQEELSGTENKIAYARQNYNDRIMEYNTKIEVFPNNIFANMLHFGKRESFAVTEEEKKPVKVSF
ncbi:MAG TPA: LemA family protein [Acidobacteriota bacterium]|nr:LemA family protein [Acidobacteriota bacterium]